MAADDDDAEFHWADYLVFVLSLVISLSIGVYFAYTGRNKKTSEEFLLAGRSMNFIPVSISLLASSISAISVLGVPADIYYRGSVYLFVTIGILICGIVTSLVFIPTFHCMGITSAYEYFDRRFGSRLLEIAVSLTFAVGLFLYLGLVLYLPALAFSEVTGLSINFSIITCGVACTLYTALGGMKAVIWTDTIQMVLVFIGIILLSIMGIYSDEVGGPSVALDRVRDGDRLNLDVWDPDPRVRHTIWTQVIGHAFIWTATVGTSQMSVQRYLSIKKTRDAQWSVLSMVFGIWILYLLIGIMSLTMYAYYYECDPKESRRIDKKDQIVPRFLMDVMGDLHGLPGLFTSSVFAAALSTVSSAVNSLAAVTLEDFIKPAYTAMKKKKMSDSAAFWTSRGMAVLYGAVAIALSFAPQHLDDDILTVVYALYGILASPVMGCFTLGMFVPWCTSTGCLLGLIAGVAMGLWMNIGSVLHGSDVEDLPVSVAGCSYYNLTITTPTVLGTTVSEEDDDPLQDFYDVSYAWYGLITWVTVMIVGVIISLIQLCCSGLRETSQKVDPDLLYDVGGRCFCCCPPGCQDAAAYGVSFEGACIRRDSGEQIIKHKSAPPRPDVNKHSPVDRQMWSERHYTDYQGTKEPYQRTGYVTRVLVDY